MKKVLIITYNFPGNGDRNTKIIKYLSTFGYEPIVLTNRTKKSAYENDIINTYFKDSNYKLYKTICLNKSPFRIFSKFFNLWGISVYLEKIFFIPDIYITWVPSALLKGLKLIQQYKVDAIITSSPPESIHITGYLLNKMTGVNWIAEFQDLWTTKKIVYSPVSRFHDLIIKKMERSIYNKADHIIANTQGNKEIYVKGFNIPKEKITVITCGYDSEEMEIDYNYDTKNGKKEFTIGYMGNFDKSGFPWKEFLTVLKKMIYSYDNIAIKVNICGHVSKFAQKYIEENGLSEYVRCHGVLPHFEAVKEIRKNDLLLLLLYETDYSHAIVPHKLYHYLGMSKPILAIAEENGEVANILNSTKTGKVVSVQKLQNVYRVLVDYYKEWEVYHSIEYEPNIDEIKKYDVTKLTEKMAEVIKALRE